MAKYEFGIQYFIIDYIIDATQTCPVDIADNVVFITNIYMDIDICSDIKYVARDRYASYGWCTRIVYAVYACKTISYQCMHSSRHWDVCVCVRWSLNRLDMSDNHNNAININNNNNNNNTTIIVSPLKR